MKKLCALLISLTMLMALCTPALAVEHAVPISAPVQTVGVRFNGEAVAFPGAKPVVRDGRTMVPAQAMLEAMGAEVRIQDKEIQFQFPDKQAGSMEGSLQLGSGSYMEDGVLYMPVRSLEGLAYDVLWDNATHSAVVVDKYDLISEIDENFTVLNDAIRKNQRDASQNYQAHMDYNITIDIADQGFGTFHAILKIKLELFYNATALEMKGSVDASSLATALDLDGAVEDGIYTALEAAALRKALSNITFDLRFDLETGTCYFHMPLLSTLSSGEISADAWLKLPMGELLGAERWKELITLQDSTTVGGMLYDYCRYLTGMGILAPADLYDATKTSGNVLAAFLGDEAAKRSGDGSAFHFGKEELKELCERAAAAAGEKLTAEDWAEVDGILETFTIDWAIQKDGTVTCTFYLRLAAESLPGGMGFRGSTKASADQKELHLTLDMGGLGKAQYDLSLTTKPVSQAPQIKPPAGAEIVDLGEMFQEEVPVLPATMEPISTP